MSVVLKCTLVKGVLKIILHNNYFADGTSETILHVLSAAPCILTSDPWNNNLDCKFASNFHIKSTKKSAYH